MDFQKIRAAMVSARSVLKTAGRDTPVDLKNPVRARVIALRINELSNAIDEIDRHTAQEIAA